MWRPELGDIEIVIFKVGAGEGRELSAGIWTEIKPHPAAGPFDLARRDDRESIRIFVDRDLFKNGIGKKMVGRGESPQDTAFWCLAHESFHIDEYERMSAVGILMSYRFSSIAGAVRHEFSKPWHDAWKALTSRYPTTTDLPPDMQVAGEIANEASADMTAIRYLKDSGRDWKRFAAQLAEMRECDDKSWQAEQVSFYSKIGFWKKKAPPYRTAAQLKSFISKKSDDLPDLIDIYGQCWRLALQKVLASGGLDTALRPILRIAENEPPIANMPSAVSSPSTSSSPIAKP